MRCGMCFKYIWITGLFYLTGASLHLVEDPPQNIPKEIDDLIVHNAIVQSMRVWQTKQNVKKNANRTKREEPSVCYEGLGCFDSSGPFGYLDMLPSKPEDINTKFLLYPARTRQRRSGSAPAEIPFEKLDEAFQWAHGGFNKSLPTKVLIHGFGSDCGYIWAYEVRSALMAVEEVNTICVDWSNGAALPNYVKASANTRLVGKQLSMLLRGLVEKTGLSLMKTHLIGFSLGAHIAGFAGADLGNLSRITGLDPAGPLFEAQDTRARLDETDAAFVDVIHSNGENLILGGLGSSQPMGHVDFYPNGGRMQKGCSHLFVGAVSDIIWSSAVEGRSLCNHRRAYKFFIDSVSPRCHFPAFPCDSYDSFLTGNCYPCTDERKCGNMGYYADKSKGRGQLYLITREEEPFCAHQYLVRIETTPGVIPVKSYGKIQVTLIGDGFLNETFMLTKKEDEEMKLGETISKIVVLHPLLSQPTNIEILYTAYSGWLSSGLTQWKIDKVMLMDSFGKISSICKKALVLESGVPKTVPLLPNDCNGIQTTTSRPEEDVTKKQEQEHIPLNYGNNKDENNLLDIETESSRSFNSRVIKVDKLNKNHVDSEDGPVREVVEPVLKTHSTKHGRSHTPGSSKEKMEISEPILGPTTARSNSAKMVTAKIESSSDKEQQQRAEAHEVNYWKENGNGDGKWKRQDESKSIKDFDSAYSSQQPPNANPIDAIVTTVQFLPQRLARMFEQAEKYARETILPLVSTYTPRFISEFIGAREEPKYVPLHYDVESEEVEQEIQDTSSSNKIITQNDVDSRALNVKESVPETTTAYTHIQRIVKRKNGDKPEEITTPIITYQQQSTESSSSSLFDNQNLTNNRRPFDFSIDFTAPGNDKSTVPTNRTLMQTLANSLQNIPDNFARMLTQVQHYTRNNILPFMQQRRWTDLIWIRPKPNSTVTVVRNNTNNGSMQSKNVAITWSISQDFNDTKENRNVSRLSGSSNVTKKFGNGTKKYSAVFVNESSLSVEVEVTSTESSWDDNVISEIRKSATAHSNNRSENEVKDINTTKEDSFWPLFKDVQSVDSTTTSTLSMTSIDRDNYIRNIPAINATHLRVVNINEPVEEVSSSSTTTTETTTVTRRVSSSTITSTSSSTTPDLTTITDSTTESIKTTPTAPTNKYNFIQRIPKRHEKIQFTLPYPLTIVIDPNDLTTTTTTTTSTTPKPPKKFESFIQKIPRKGKSKLTSFKVYRNHPWSKDYKIGTKVVPVINRYGGDIKYRIGPDGKFEI